MPQEKLHDILNDDGRVYYIGQRIEQSNSLIVNSLQREYNKFDESQQSAFQEVCKLLNKTEKDFLEASSQHNNEIGLKKAYNYLLATNQRLNGRYGDMTPPFDSLAEDRAEDGVYKVNHNKADLITYIVDNLKSQLNEHNLFKNLMSFEAVVNTEERSRSSSFSIEQTASGCATPRQPISSSDSATVPSPAREEDSRSQKKIEITADQLKLLETIQGRGLDPSRLAAAVEAGVFDNLYGSIEGIQENNEERPRPEVNVKSAQSMTKASSQTK
ncbi:MAG: hypothetical protein ACI9IL_001039 [Rickettsiales bacterium]|jgi:hypothetical protein